MCLNVSGILWVSLTSVMKILHILAPLVIIATPAAGLCLYLSPVVALGYKMASAAAAWPCMWPLESLHPVAFNEFQACMRSSRRFSQNIASGVHGILLAFHVVFKWLRMIGAESSYEVSIFMDQDQEKHLRIGVVRFYSISWPSFLLKTVLISDIHRCIILLQPERLT